jgi:lysophospholipase L1-like esterase
VSLIIAMLGVGALLLAIYQGTRVPDGRPDFVALGSSFAAGAGLGPLQPRSPILCARSVGGYPQQLARMRHLAIVDVTCGGGKVGHVVRGGQFFPGPQVRVIDKDTRLVTVTVGGNDVSYIGDLSMLAARNSNSLFGALVRSSWKGPQPVGARNFRSLEDDMAAMLWSIHQRAPGATIVLVTYPVIVPPSATCARIGLTPGEAALMRAVGDQLAATSRTAAKRGGALLVDMHVLGAGHDACSSEPWVAGWSNGGVAPFHPNARGARATAEAVSKALG